MDKDEAETEGIINKYAVQFATYSMTISDIISNTMLRLQTGA